MRKGIFFFRRTKEENETGSGTNCSQSGFVFYVVLKSDYGQIAVSSCGMVSFASAGRFLHN